MHMWWPLDLWLYQLYSPCFGQQHIKHESMVTLIKSKEGNLHIATLNL